MKKIVLITTTIIVLIFVFIGQWQLDIGSDCTIEPAKEHSKLVYAETPGVMSNFYFRSGDSVEKGTVLGKLTDFELQDNLEQIQAAMNETMANLEVMQKQMQEKGQAVVSANLRKLKAESEFSLVNKEVIGIKTGKLPSDIELLRVKTLETKRAYDKLAKEQENIKKKQYPPEIEGIEENMQQAIVQMENQKLNTTKNKYLASVGAISNLDYENAQAKYEIALHACNNYKAKFDEALQNHFYDTMDARDLYIQNKENYEANLRDFLLKHNKLGYDSAIASADVKYTALGEGTQIAQIIAAKEKIKALKQKQAIFLAKEKKLALKAPISGIVIENDITNRIGKYLTMGEMVCEVASLESVLVKILIDEKDISEIKLGQSVRLKVKPLQGSLFKGKVIKISPVAKFEESKKRNFYTIELVIDNPKGQLKPGMTGFAKINCGNRPVYSLISRELGHLIRSEYWFF